MGGELEPLWVCRVPWTPRPGRNHAKIFRESVVQMRCLPTTSDSISRGCLLNEGAHNFRPTAVGSAYAVFAVRPRDSKSTICNRDAIPNQAIRFLFDFRDFPLNSLSVRVLYIFSMASEWLSWGQIRSSATFSTLLL